MITATIGRIFLDAYNQKFGTQYNAKDFFLEVYHPLFFDSSKYLQWVQNSPFVQMKKGQKVETLTLDERHEKLQDFIKKVDECKVPDASIAPGFPASEEKEFATTSGQVTNMNLPTAKDDVYLSWIGSSLGIGMQGGYLLIFEPAILLDLFEGWQLYREVLSNNAKLKGNQVNAWNGQWLVHRYNKNNYYPKSPMIGFDFNTLFEETKDGMNIATLSWTKILIKIAQYSNKSKLHGYFYGFDPQRKLPITIGFIPINLEGIKRPLDLYKKFFGMHSNEGSKADDLWGTEYSLKQSCQLGMLGIKAMQPKGLRQYMTSGKDEEVKLPKYNEKQTINYHTYQIWLLAMLNNEELWNKSIEFARILQAYVNKDKKLSTKRGNMVKNILASNSKRSFIMAITEIASEVEDFTKVEENVKVINIMPNDNVPYYLALIRFHFAGLANKNNQQT